MKIRSRSSTAWVYVIVGALVVLATLLILGGWLWYRMVTEEGTAWFLTPEATQDRWLATSILGKQYGFTVHSDWTLDADDLPALTDTVVLEDVRSSIVDETISNTLEAWVLKGGTLIYRVPVLYNEKTPPVTTNFQFFPNKLGVFEIRDRNLVIEILERMDGREKQDCATRTLPITFSDDDVALHDWRSSHTLDTSSSPYVDDLVPLSKMHFLRMNYGQGQVFMVTDLKLWSNHFVACADNAYVFVRMVLGAAKLMPSLVHEVSVWIVPRAPVNTPHIFALVWNNYHFPIIGIVLTFFVSLVARNLRSSPAVHAILVPRRATIDYVTSVTEFAWRKNSVESFFRAFLWIAKNPTGIFGPGKPNESALKRADSNRRAHINMNPSNEEDLVHSVRALQTELRQNMQPSLRES